MALFAVDLHGDSEMSPGEVDATRPSLENHHDLASWIGPSKGSHQLHEQGLGIAFRWWRAGRAEGQYRSKAPTSGRSGRRGRPRQLLEPHETLPEGSFDGAFDDERISCRAEVYQRPQCRSHGQAINPDEVVGADGAQPKEARTPRMPVPDGNVKVAGSDSIKTQERGGRPAAEECFRSDAEDSHPELLLPARLGAGEGVNPALLLTERALRDHLSPLELSDTFACELSGIDGARLPVRHRQPFSCHFMMLYRYCTQVYTPVVTEHRIEPPQDWIETNRRMWDERVPIHTASAFYDIDAFKAGRPAVEPFEVDELGPLGGLRLVHLQCHFGLDTLDLVRLHPTLTATGLDFSLPAVEAATQLARDLHLDDRVNFVHADVRHATATLRPGTFDVVYTGKGAIIWLPDLDEWANQCAQLLKPGGWLYVCEFHPVGMCLAEDTPTIQYDYFDPDPLLDESSGTYADLEAPTVHNRSYEWQHPLSQVITALMRAGLELRFLHEWDYTLYQLGTWLTRGADGRYRWPGDAKLPLMYSLKARKPPPPTPVAP